MPKGIVNQLEIVQIKEQERVCLILLRLGRHGCAYFVAEGGLVQQIRQTVALGAALKLGTASHFFININNFTHKAQGCVLLADACGLHSAPDIAPLGSGDAHDCKSSGVAAADAPPQFVEGRADLQDG